MNGRTLAAALMSAITGAGAALGVAYAIPDSAGVIQACYKKGGLLQERGELRVIDEGRCTSTEEPLSWNQAGPPGPAGPKGDRGEKGDKGDSGLTSVAHQKEGPSVLLPSIPNTLTVVAGVTVPAGAYVVQFKGLATNTHSNWTGSRTGSCRLYEDETPIDFSFFSFAGNAQRATSSLLAARSVTHSTTYDVRCQSDEPNTSLLEPVIVATRVGGLG